MKLKDMVKKVSNKEIQQAQENEEIRHLGAVQKAMRALLTVAMIPTAKAVDICLGVACEISFKAGVPVEAIHKEVDGYYEAGAKDKAEMDELMKKDKEAMEKMAAEKAAEEAKPKLEIVSR